MNNKRRSHEIPYSHIPMKKKVLRRGNSLNFLILHSLQIGVPLHRADLNSLGGRKDTDRALLILNAPPSKGGWGRRRRVSEDKNGDGRRWMLI